jgi:hypothetical protein
MFGIISTVISVAVKVVSIIGELGIGLKGLEVIGKVLVSIAKSLGLIEDENVETEELGDKALQAEMEGIKPENYETYQEYMKEIENFEIDPEKSRKLTEKEKIEKGIEITSALLVEKYGPDVQGLILETVKNPEFFNSERVKEYIKLADGDKISYSEITNYLDGNIRNFDHIDKVSDAMVDIEKKIDPNISDIDAQKTINAQKR